MEDQTTEQSIRSREVKRVTEVQIKRQEEGVDESSEQPDGKQHLATQQETSTQAFASCLGVLQIKKGRAQGKCQVQRHPHFIVHL